MGEDAGLRLLVARADLRRTRFAADGHSPAERELGAGEVRLAVERFALTSNNVTYGAFGDAMKYWDFFPTGDPAWGCIPVWGFARVVESRVEAIAVGRRVWGFLPMGAYLIVRPERIGHRGFVDGSGHRAALPALYNGLTFCDADPAWQPQREAQQALLRPLFATSFLIADFLREAGNFGASRVVLSSASSKTAYCTAFCLRHGAQQASPLHLVGLTSAANQAFTASLGCYDDVIEYAALDRLDAPTPTIYIDFSGDAEVRKRVHEVLAAQLRYSCAVGGTHWEGLGSASGLAGPRPVLFFAPTHYQQRAAPPPKGIGAVALEAQLSGAWEALMERVCSTAQPWMLVDERRGADQVEAVYRMLLDGRGDPRRGYLASF